MTIRNLDALFRPQRVWFLGSPQTPVQAAALNERVARGGAGVQFTHLESALPGPSPEAAAQPMLAVLADPRFANAESVARLGELGCRALLWPLREPPAPAVLAAAGRHTLRILGPRSVGLVNPGLGLDVSTLAQTPAKGQIALVVQSQSVAAAAVDWAIGRRIGFSWVAVTGGEADVDIADLLDYAALDANTQSVAVEVGRIRGARKFMSAARACARAKPTVILQTRLADAAAAGADPVRTAAFARAGLVEVPNLPALFDALAALQRLPPMERPRVLVAANGAALCALSIDAVLRQQLGLAELGEEVRAQLLTRVPEARFRPGAVDLGEPDPATTVAVLRQLLDVAGVDALLFVRSPVAGYPHEPVARAVVEAGFPARLLTVWLGLESALPARRLAAEAGQPTFTSPDAAARALRYRHEHARNRELLTQTPPPNHLPRLDVAAVGERLAHLRERHGDGLDAAAAEPIFASYGLGSRSRAPREAMRLRVQGARHPELGMHLSVQLQVQGLSTAVAYAFPPLDALIATRLLHDAGLQLSPECREQAADALICLAQLLMDQPLIEQLDVVLLVEPQRARLLRGSKLQLATPPAERSRLALAPYPSRMAHTAPMRDGFDYHLRPVRPSDEPAVIELLKSLDAESVRLRFFAHIRYFSHAMAARMTQIDYDRELGLVVHRADQPDALVALGTLVLDPDEASGEFALLVHQDCARLGLGRHLLRCLVDRGRERGVGLIWGEILTENQPMLGLARALGFSLRRDPQDPSCTIAELRLKTAP